MGRNGAATGIALAFFLWALVWLTVVILTVWVIVHFTRKYW